MYVTLLLNQVTSFPVSGIGIVKPNTIRYPVSGIRCLSGIVLTLLTLNVQTWTQFDAEFLKSAVSNDYLPYICMYSQKQIVKSASFVDPPNKCAL